MGFKGGLSAGNYNKIADSSPATTTRDLAGLVEKGALTRAGERKHARYALNLPLRTVRESRSMRWARLLPEPVLRLRRKAKP